MSEFTYQLYEFDDTWDIMVGPAYLFNVDDEQQAINFVENMNFLLNNNIFRKANIKGYTYPVR